MILLFLYCFLFTHINGNPSPEVFHSLTTLNSIKTTNLSERSPNEQWVYIFNNKIESINSVYLPNAVLLSSSGVIYNTEAERKDFYLRLKNRIGKIKSISSTKNIDVTPDQSYEIGYFLNSENKKFAHLIIWRKVNDIVLRELEMLSESENVTIDMKSIGEARNRWMKLCNNHEIKELVSKVYFENAIYYNNYRVVIGTDNITSEYRYMNNPAYQLTLSPIILETVTESLVFEIGQCAGSYAGKYLLVWGNLSGKWRVIFDAN